MANQNNKGLKRIINAIRYSLAGFKACYRHEEAFRQETYVLIPMLPLGLWLGNDGVERALRSLGVPAGRIHSERFAI